MYLCKYCPREFEKYRSRNAHLRCCTLNPLRDPPIPKTSRNILGARGAHSRVRYEHKLSDILRSEGFEVFDPREVCDRVAIKDGQVFFIEFKKLNQVLRPAQEKVRVLVPDIYKVIFDTE